MGKPPQLVYDLLDLQASVKAAGEAAGIVDPVPDDHIHRGLILRLEERTAAAMTVILKRLHRRLFADVSRENVGDILRRLSSPDLNEDLRQELYNALIPISNAGAASGREQIREAIGPRMKAAGMPLDLSFNWTLVNQQARRWLNRHTFLLTYANQYSLTASTERKLRGMIDNFITNPDITMPQLSRQAEQLFDIARGEMIAVTEVTRVFAGANMTAWRESKVVQSVRWNTAHDKLVCRLCAPLNGKVTPIGTPFDGWIDHPPAHSRCRCWLTPVVEVPEWDSFFDTRGTYDPYENIRPPIGRAPQGKGQEYRDRQAIVNMLNTQQRYRGIIQTKLDNYRGQRYLRRDIDMAILRKQELDKAIAASLEFAEVTAATGGDWGFARQAVKEIFQYVSFMTG